MCVVDVGYKRMLHASFAIKVIFGLDAPLWSEIL